LQAQLHPHFDTKAWYLSRWCRELENGLLLFFKAPKIVVKPARPHRLTDSNIFFSFTLKKKLTNQEAGEPLNSHCSPFSFPSYLITVIFTGHIIISVI
jgi:hypothetical protein